MRARTFEQASQRGKRDAISLDVLDQDARRLECANEVLKELPEGRRHGLRPGELGEADAEARAPEIAALVGEG